MKKQNLEKPFFSKFLENQLDKKTGTNVQGGGDDPPHTMSLADSPETKKYPSDSDEVGTNPISDLAQTQKYPSDGDDNPIPVEK